jgi:hypothetical protein
VAQTQGFFLGEHQGLAGPCGEPFEIGQNLLRVRMSD